MVDMAEVSPECYIWICFRKLSNQLWIHVIRNLYLRSYSMDMEFLGLGHYGPNIRHTRSRVKPLPRRRDIGCHKQKGLAANRSHTQHCHDWHLGPSEQPTIVPLSPGAPPLNRTAINAIDFSTLTLTMWLWWTSAGQMCCRFDVTSYVK